MVGEAAQCFLLEDMLTEKQVHQIVKQAIGEDISWKLKGCEIKAAVDGLVGFFGDHMRGTLQVLVDGEVKKIHLFMKSIPMSNQPKADFIDSHHYFRRETIMYKVLEEIREDNDPNPWCPKAYIYTDTMIVMPDLTFEGYTSYPYLDTLDLQHVLLSVATIARFHAGFTNYETKKSIAVKRPYNTYQEYGTMLDETTFCDSPFIKTCAKLTANFLKVYSLKSYRDLPDLESQLAEKFLVACDSVTEEKATLNVLIHKDLWVNNILFRYHNNVPINAVIVDFQLIRYAPPAFDLMIFLYLTTSRRFREEHEKEIFDHYFSAFSNSLDDDSHQRIADLGYNKENFLHWCEQSRMFGVLEPASIYPFILMDPKAAQKNFDDPETFDKYLNDDRTVLVLEYAKKCSVYRERLLEVCEEFVERYILNCDNCVFDVENRLSRTDPSTSDQQHIAKK